VLPSKLQKAIVALTSEASFTLEALMILVKADLRMETELRSPKKRAPLAELVKLEEEIEVEP